MAGKDGSICGHLCNLKPIDDTSNLSRHLQRRHKEHHFEWSTASSKYNQEKHVAAAAKVTGTNQNYL